MNEFEWINVTSKTFDFCLQLLREIKELKEKIATLEEEKAKLKDRLLEERLVQDDRGYDTVY